MRIILYYYALAGLVSAGLVSLYCIITAESFKNGITLILVASLLWPIVLALSIYRMIKGG
nr:MAG TPA: hypothetical protein [Caudoviricetes sp.]